MTRLLLTSAAVLALSPAALAQEGTPPDLRDEPIAAPEAAQDLHQNRTPRPTQIVTPEVEPVTPDTSKPDDSFVYNEDRDVVATGIKPNETDDMVFAAAPADAAGTDKLAAFYHAMDFDGDSLVSQAEWERYHADTPYALRFETYSADGDDTLTLSEYRRGVEGRYSPDPVTH